MLVICLYLLFIDIFVNLHNTNLITMNISFTKKQQQYISEQVANGDFQNASEVVRDAMRLHQIYRTRVLEELRQDIAKGWEGDTSSRKVSDIVKSKRKAYI